MMRDDRAGEALEIYKLQAELADRVSQRRLGTNRTYASLLVGLMLFLSTLVRIDNNTWQDGLVFCVVGILGTVLAVSWDRVVRSYGQLNAGKFRALQELEKKLAYPFFEREWHFLGQGKKANRYLRLSRVERSTPWVFFGLYVAVFAYGVSRWVTHP